jgi:hypothetical protein
MSQFNALITNLTMNDDAFAVIPETGESIYIPPGVTRAAKLVAGEHRTVTVIENNPERKSNTPWMGVYVEPPATEMPAAHKNQDPSTADRALELLQNGYLTTGEMAEQLAVDTTVARDILNKLFAERKVARADVHYGSNKRALHVLWAKTPEDFL